MLLWMRFEFVRHPAPQISLLSLGLLFIVAALPQFAVKPFTRVLLFNLSSVLYVIGFYESEFRSMRAYHHVYASP